MIYKLLCNQGASEEGGWEKEKKREGEWQKGQGRKGERETEAMGAGENGRR